MLLWTPLCSRLSGPVPSAVPSRITFRDFTFRAVSTPWRRRMRATTSDYLCIVRPWLRQGLGCLDKLFLVLHVLTHVFISARSLTCCASARSLTCCAWSGSPRPNSEEDSSPSRHCAWRSVIPELGCSGSVQRSVGHLVVGMVVDSAVPRVVHICASLGMPRRWSLCLEGLYRKRRSAPSVRLCSARLPSIVHSSALVRRVSASASGLHSRRSSV